MAKALLGQYVRYDDRHELAHNALLHHGRSFLRDRWYITDSGFLTGGVRSASGFGSIITASSEQQVMSV